MLAEQPRGLSGSGYLANPVNEIFGGVEKLEGRIIGIVGLLCGHYGEGIDSTTDDEVS